MDIHRCRFVPIPPSTINALAFSRSYSPPNHSDTPPRLALGRANGDIEIWNPLRGSWLQETIIRGGKERSVDGLVWTQDPDEVLADGKVIHGKKRLFSIGFSSTITEWDLARGAPRRQASGNHSEIWCIAAQPLDEKSTIQESGDTLLGQHLVAGCTDGTLVLYTTEDDGLQFKKIVARPAKKKSKAVSIAFKDRNTVVVGFSDSMIRVYDIRAGQCIRSMSLGGGRKGGPKETIVWSIKVLKQGDIVSADSSGEVKIWDGKLYTLMQRIKSHGQDVLSLATNHDGTLIFSGGMDRRTVMYAPAGKGQRRWAEVAHKRFHTHDVKTMASLEYDGISVVVSGGEYCNVLRGPLLTMSRTGCFSHRASTATLWGRTAQNATFSPSRECC